MVFGLDEMIFKGTELVLAFRCELISSDFHGGRVEETSNLCLTISLSTERRVLFDLHM